MDEPVQGIWHEKKRNRWRVKIFKDGQLCHRSYHRSYDAALLTWREERKRILVPSGSLKAQPALSSIQKFLRQPRIGAGGVPSTP